MNKYIFFLYILLVPYSTFSTLTEDYTIVTRSLGDKQLRDSSFSPLHGNKNNGGAADMMFEHGHSSTNCVLHNIARCMLATSYHPVCMILLSRVDRLTAPAHLRRSC